MKPIALVIPSEDPRSGVFVDYPHGTSHGIPMYALADLSLIHISEPTRPY